MRPESDPEEVLAWEAENPPTVTRPGEQRWGRIAVHVARDPNLSMPARALYALLTTYANDSGRDRCIPSMPTLMEQTGASRPTLRRWVQELVDAGVLEVVRRWRPDGSQTSNEYRLHDGIGDLNTRGGGNVGVRGAPHAGVRGGGNVGVPPKNNTSSNTTKEHPPSPSHSPSPAVPDAQESDLFGEPVAPSPVRLVPSPAQVEEAFDEWWALYPRKVGKGAARRAYVAAVRKVGPDPLLVGLRAQLPSLGDKPPKYRPHPSTWLNEERWGDEVEPTPPVMSHEERMANLAQGCTPDALDTLPAPVKRDAWGFPL